MIDPCSEDATSVLSLEEAQARIKSALLPVAGTEIVVLKSALGRVLAQPVYSPVNIPHDRNAAMDGYALAARDIVPDQAFSLNLAGTSWAGRPFQGKMQPGQCIRIFTGAVLPERADTVIMQEHVQADGQTVHFPAHARPYRHVREIGEDMQQGACLISPPKKLTVADLGLLASAGIHEITVRRRLNIVFFSTGDELAAMGQALKPGKIYDSNRYILNGLLTGPGYSITDKGVIADDRDKLENSLIEAAENHDVIITTGGASVGEADFIKDILTSRGQVNFWKIAMKPGKPLIFGKIGHCYVFGLPGNPVSVIATFDQLVKPALQQLTGEPVAKPLRLTAICTSPLKKTPGRQEFQRGILTQNDNGELFVSSSGKQGSHLLGSISRANCYIVLPADCSGVEAGAPVVVEPFSLLLQDR
ncbi:MAG: molybdopterin molybdotransferase MoeA [Methylobacter sp.]|uniref:molybdopterin molybdotransferase MoeA n=1 Tax=Methylobacter sp. TaxID=2051955 RepID=UPI0025835129|nr:gephyrin-like molybdotransferase Glp [Methylobacter sp.]MCL7419458.1 molybdopterin molybdotransferase MoeA [Methylobacter sp.]